VSWTGNATERTIDVGFQPDLVWAKTRSNAASHNIVDAVRGVKKLLSSNANDAELTESDTAGIDSFVSNGFTLEDATYYEDVNQSGRTYVAWNWKANGSGESNTDGSITSTVSANPTSGFSIVTYTGTGSAATIGHGLGIAPSMIIVKNRSSAFDWAGYHVATGPTINYPINVNGTGYTNTAYWNDTSPTSSVFYVGNNSANTNVNGSSFVAYCFAGVEGFSAFGSYTGNGSTDGPFVYTGFRPAYVLIKCTSTSPTEWHVWDDQRSTYNVMNRALRPNNSNAESDSTDYSIDFLSNGAKIRNASNLDNQNGQTFIYAAFAENPFKNSLAR